MGPVLLSVAEKSPLYGGIIFLLSVFSDENICPLFGDVCCIVVSVDGGSVPRRWEQRMIDSTGNFE